jgi:hypothetical protein
VWRWEVIYKNSKGVVKSLVSERGHAGRVMAFIQYLTDSEAITKALKEEDCKVVLSETIIFDNDRLYGDKK